MPARDQLAITRNVAGCLSIERDNVPHFRKLIANAKHFLKLLTRIYEYKLGIRMVNDVSNLFRRARWIKTDCNSTGHDRADIADGPLGNIPHQNTNRSTTFQTKRQERRREIKSLLLKPPPRNPLPPILQTKVKDILLFDTVRRILLHAINKQRIHSRIFHLLNSNLTWTGSVR